MNNPQESIATAESPRDYAGLLWIFAASILGFSLFCGASAIALSDPTLDTPIAIEPGQVVDFAFSNPNSGAILTAEAFSELIPTWTVTPTLTASPTGTPSPTSSPSNTPVVFTKTPTREPQNQNPPPTRRPNPTNTAIVVKTQASTPIPPILYGCTDPSATNYDPLATIEDGSCIYPPPIFGCTDPAATNYDPLATIDDGSCTY